TSSRFLPLYVGAVAAAAVAALVLAFLLAPAGALLGPRPAGFALLAALLIIGEARPLEFLRLHEGSDITISWTFAFALVLLAPSRAWPAMAIASALGDGIRRKPFVRIVFNVSQMVCSLGASVLILSLVHGDNLFARRGPSPLWLSAMALAAVAAYFVNLL